MSGAFKWPRRDVATQLLRGRVNGPRATAHTPNGFGVNRASVDGDIRATFGSALLSSAKSLFAHAKLT